MKQIAYYISSHGYGHAARSIPVLQGLTESGRVHIKTRIPEAFFQIYLNPGYRMYPQEVDAGCIQKDYVSIDIGETWSRAEDFYRNHAVRRTAETRWMRETPIDIVISDVPGYPLQAAREAEIPSLLIGNFTWLDIYGAFPGAEKHEALLEILRQEYASATIQILPQCHLVTGVVKQKREVGFIGLRGRGIRDRLEKHLGVRLAGKTLVFIYLGQFDASRVKWENLRNLRDCVFVTRDPLPQPSLCENLFLLDDRFRYPDLVASSDIVCTKAGYSTLANAFAHGKPVISCERENFIEFEVMKDFMVRHGIGCIIDSERFTRGEWEDAIKTAAAMSVKGKVKLNGEVEVLQIVKTLTGH